MPARKLPQQKRSIENYNKILDSAVHLISATGTENITTKDIAHNAGIAVGSIYRFFDNVDDIKGAIVERFLEAQYQYIHPLYALLGSISVDEFIGRVIDELAVFYKANRDSERVSFIMRTSEAFVLRNEVFTQRILAELLESIHTCYQVLDEEGLRNRLVIMIEISDAITMKMAATESASLYEAYLKEWRTLFKLYTLSPFLTAR